MHSEMGIPPELVHRKPTRRILDRFSRITAFAFDVDGTLTDGTLYVLPDGTLARRMHIRDGFALHTAIQRGYPVFIISGARGEGVRERLARLGVEEVYTGVQDKLALLQELALRYELDLTAILYMGDDLPDIPVLKAVGLSACPRDAASHVREICHYVCMRRGGEGCAREVIEITLSLHGKWLNLSWGVLD